MPIANCYINQITVSNQKLEALTKEWATVIEVDISDICLSFVEVAAQTGQTYKIVVNLFLPSLWDKSNIEKIQLSLDILLKRHLQLESEDVFIITNIVQSGNIMESGKIVKWN